MFGPGEGPPQSPPGFQRMLGPSMQQMRPYGFQRLQGPAVGLPGGQPGMPPSMAPPQPPPMAPCKVSGSIKPKINFLCVNILGYQESCGILFSFKF